MKRTILQTFDTKEFYLANLTKKMYLCSIKVNKSQKIHVLNKYV